MVAKTRKTGKYHVSKHASGRWKKTIKGKTYYFKTKDEAKRELDFIYAQLEGRSSVDTNLLTLRDAINTYLTDFEQNIGKPRRTLDRFNTLKRILPEAGKQIGLDKHLDKLIPADFSQYVSWCFDKYAATTVQTHFNGVKACLNWVYNEGFIDRPIRLKKLKVPADVLRKHRNAKKKTYTAPEVARLLDAADDWLKVAIYLALYAGYLPVDLKSAPASVLDGDCISFARGKTGRLRRAYLPEEAVILLNKQQVYRRETDALLPTRYGKKRTKTSNSHTKSLQTLNERLGIDVTPAFEGFRKVCRTVTGGCDPEASRVITGQQHDAIAEVYLDNTLIGRDRLIACRDAMTAWIESGRQEAGQ